MDTLRRIRRAIQVLVIYAGEWGAWGRIINDLFFNRRKLSGPTDGMAGRVREVGRQRGVSKGCGPRRKCRESHVNRKRGRVKGAARIWGGPTTRVGGDLRLGCVARPRRCCKVVKSPFFRRNSLTVIAHCSAARIINRPAVIANSPTGKVVTTPSDSRPWFSFSRTCNIQG